jgi:hypothetical protein
MRVVVLLGASAFLLSCGSGSDDTGSGPSGGGGAINDSGTAPSNPDVANTPTGNMAVWTSHAGTKIQPTTAKGSSTVLALDTYRDAYASAQLAVRAEGGHLEGVTVSVAADLKDGAGHTLAQGEITFYREYFIDFTSLPKDNVVGTVPAPASSPTHDGNVPDPLIPLVDPYTGANAGQPFNVAEGRNQGIFVDVHVAKGLAGGTYTGTVHVAAAAGGSADVPISVTVYALDIPDMRSVTTHFKMSVNDLDKYHPGMDSCSGTTCWEDLNKGQGAVVLKRYEDLVHAHRADTAQARVSAPSNGCAPPTASDFTSWDAQMAPYMDGSYFTDGVPSSRFGIPLAPGTTWGTATTTSCAGSTCTTACTQTQYQAIAKVWADHLTAKSWFPNPATDGWFGPVIYAYDEPLAAGGNVQALLDAIASDSAWIQAADPGWKAHIIDTVSPIDKPNAGGVATQPILTPALGVYVVAPVLYGDVWQHGAFYGRTEWATLLAGGTQLWFYEGNSITPPWPSFATNTLDGNEPVMMMWAAWREHATGYLYWDITDWVPQTDPWGFEISFGKTGDGVLIYPGNHAGSAKPAGSPSDVAIDGPIPSYRLKRIRQGLQDWALFRYAESKGLTAFVEQQVDTVYTKLGAIPASGATWTSDETEMATIRAAVVQRLLGD